MWVHTASVLKVIADRLNSSVDEATQAVVTGIFETVCGIGFLILCGNSLQLFDNSPKLSVDALGMTVPKIVVDALIAMQIALIWFLYLIISGIVKKVKLIHGMNSLLDRKADFATNPVQVLDVLDLNGHFYQIIGLTASWEEGMSASFFSSEYEKVEAALRG